jgi:ABC-type amino acid transport substrate-binding protein
MYKSEMFKPAKKNPTQEDEKLLEEVLWEKYESEIKLVLSKKTGREPSVPDIKSAFNVLIKHMRENGTLELALQKYLEEKEVYANDPGNVKKL